MRPFNHPTSTNDGYEEVLNAILTSLPRQQLENILQTLRTRLRTNDLHPRVAAQGAEIIQQVIFTRHHQSTYGRVELNYDDTPERPTIANSYSNSQGHDHHLCRTTQSHAHRPFHSQTEGREYGRLEPVAFDDMETEPVSTTKQNRTDEGPKESKIEKNIDTIKGQRNDNVVKMDTSAPALGSGAKANRPANLIEFDELPKHIPRELPNGYTKPATNTATTTPIHQPYSVGLAASLHANPDTSLPVKPPPTAPRVNPSGDAVAAAFNRYTRTPAEPIRERDENPYEARNVAVPSFNNFTFPIKHPTVTPPKTPACAVAPPLSLAPTGPPTAPLADRMKAKQMQQHNQQQFQQQPEPEPSPTSAEEGEIRSPRHEHQHSTANTHFTTPYKRPHARSTFSRSPTSSSESESDPTTFRAPLRKKRVTSPPPVEMIKKERKSRGREARREIRREIRRDEKAEEARAAEVRALAVQMREMMERLKVMGGN